MAPKPSDKELEAELLSTVKQIYTSAEHDLLTVNYARENAEEKLGLNDGFFREGAWKEKSKQIIKDEVAKLNENEPSSQITPKSTPNIRKRAPQHDAEPTPTPTKKQRTSTAKSGKAEETAEKKRGVAKAKPSPQQKASAAKKKAKPKEVEEEEDTTPVKSRQRRAAAPGPKRQGKSASKVVASDSDENEDDPEAAPDTELSEIDEAPTKRTPKKATAKKAEATTEVDTPQSDVPDENTQPKSDAKTVVDKTDSEESIVFDEPPKTKRKRNAKDASEKPAAKPKPKAKAAKTKTELSPDEEEIKTLQSHLVKCGVRKIWPIELKSYGSDNRAKIRHLKDMLKEVGMTGRFSDARAREIMERRELEAELEAVKEMNEQWGTNGGGRASRSRAARPQKSLKVDADDEAEDSDESANEESDESVEEGSGDDDDDEGDDDDDEDEEDEGPPQKRARALTKKRKADFAFLGDEEESD